MDASHVEVRCQGELVARHSRCYRVPIDDVVLPSPDRPDLLLALNEAMIALADVSPDKCQMVEMHFFGGMTQEEIAEVMKLHVNTVARQLPLAQAWPQARLTE